MAHWACLALTFLLLGMACEELLALMLSATRCYRQAPGCSLSASISSSPTSGCDAFPTSTDT